MYGSKVKESAKRAESLYLWVNGRVWGAVMTVCFYLKLNAVEW